MAFPKGGHHSEATKIKIINALKGIFETKKSIWFNKNLSEEHKLRIGESCKKKWATFDSRKRSRILRGVNNSKRFSGRKHSSEAKQKISQSLIGRKHSEETKKKIGDTRKGNKCYWFWKGGITPLHIQIRNSLEWQIWRKKTFEKDNYTCQKCGLHSGNGKAVHLEAHHKKEFSIIFQEFLRRYSQFSPIEDKETLLRLAFTYEPFWDVDNGKTLCNECHNQTKKGVNNVCFVSRSD